MSRPIHFSFDELVSESKDVYDICNIFNHISKSNKTNKNPSQERESNDIYNLIMMSRPVHFSFDELVSESKDVNDHFDERTDRGSDDHAQPSSKFSCKKINV